MLYRGLKKLARSAAPFLLPSLPGSSLSWGPPRRYSNTTYEWISNCSNTDSRYEQVLSGVSFTNVRATHTELELPLNLQNSADISVPPQSVVELSRGRVYGSDPAIITDDDHILLDLSMYFAPYHSQLFYSIQLPPPLVISDPVLVLAGMPGSNYGHWLHQMMPRLHLAELAGWRPSDFRYVVINTTPSGFAEEMLLAAGFSQHQLLRVSPSLHIQASPLVVPSIPPAGNPPAWISDFLRRRFSQDIREPSLRIFASRANARWRRIANEAALYPVLLEFGFEIIYPDTLDFLSSVRIFESADVVCGLHGANLSNICFCRPGSTLVEIYHPQHPELYFWTTATGAGLNYAFILGEGPTRDTPDLSPFSPGNHTDVVVNPTKLRSTLLAAGLSPV